MAQTNSISYRPQEINGLLWYKGYVSQTNSLCYKEDAQANSLCYKEDAQANSLCYKEDAQANSLCYKTIDFFSCS